MNKLIAAIALSAMLTACGTAETAGPASNAETTTTRAPRITDTSGRPDITFDPCHDIPDDIMNAAGYNAAKKKIADYPMGTYTFLGCSYQDRNAVPGIRRGYGLSVLSGNVTLSEEISKNGLLSQHTTVNGRAALLRVHPDERLSCTYVLETDFGIVIIDRLYHSDSGEDPPIADWCEGLDELVSDIEHSIDK